MRGITVLSLTLVWSADVAVAASLPVSVPLLLQEGLTDDPQQAGFQLLAGLDREQEPVSLGLPMPAAAAICDSQELGLAGGAQVSQFRVLRRRSDALCGGTGSVEWVLVDTQADLAAGEIQRSLTLTRGSGNSGGADLATDQGATILVDTGAAQFTVRKTGFNLLDRVSVGGLVLVSPGASAGIELVGDDGVLYRAALDPAAAVAIEENGPARTVVVARGRHVSASGAWLMEWTVRLHFYRGKSRVRLLYTLRNASQAQIANSFFQSLDLAVATTLAAPTYALRTAAGELAGALAAGQTLALFQGENSFPTRRDWDFEDVDAQGNPITAKWPTTIQGYTVRRDGTLLASGDRNQPIPLLWGQARGASGAVTFGTRFAAGWWPQGLRLSADGTVRVGLFPAGNDKLYASRFTSHATREVLLDFSAAPASGEEAMFRFQYPLTGRATEVNWYNRSGAFWERMLSTTEERDFYLARGWPTPYPDDWRPELQLPRHIYWGAGGGRNQYDQAKVAAWTFLRDDSPWSGGYWTLADLRFHHNADLAIYHSDDFDGSRDDIPSFDELPGVEAIPTAKVTFESEHLHAYGLALWYYLTGDERIREAYTDWGEHLHHFRPLGYNPWERGLNWNLFNLVDLFRFTGNPWHRELAWQLFTSEILDRSAIYQVSPGTDWQRGFYASSAATFDGDGQPRADRFLASFVLGGMYPRTYAYLHDFAAADEQAADRARDVLEGISRFIVNEHWFDFGNPACDYGFPYYQSVDSVPPDPRLDGNWICGFKEVWLSHYWAYVLTGDPQLLARAERIEELLTDLGITGEFQDWPDRQTLEHLLIHPEQHDRWQDLPLTVVPNGGGSYTLSWTVPDRARQFWIKLADRPIVPWLGFDRQSRQFGFDPVQFVPFFAADNVSGEPVAAAAGVVQSLVVTGLDPATSYSFAARCRIGAAIPAPLAIFADGFESGDLGAWSVPARSVP